MPLPPGARLRLSTTANGCARLELQPPGPCPLRCRLRVWGRLAVVLPVGRDMAPMTRDGSEGEACREWVFVVRTREWGVCDAGLQPSSGWSVGAAGCRQRGALVSADHGRQ